MTDERNSLPPPDRGVRLDWADIPEHVPCGDESRLMAAALHPFPGRLPRWKVAGWSQTVSRHIWQSLAFIPILLLASVACSKPALPLELASPAPATTEAPESTPPAPVPTEALEFATCVPKEMKEPEATPSPIHKQAPATTFTPVPLVTATPRPAAEVTPQPTRVKTTEAVATPVPSPTITAKPTAVPIPSTGERDRVVTTRDMEYDYAIQLLDGWSRVEKGLYSGRAPAGSLSITSQYLPRGYTLEQFTRMALFDLRRDWWPAASHFEIITVEETMADDQPAVRIRYRVQQSPDYCVIDVAELVTVSHLLPGNPHGFRAMAWICQHDLRRYGHERDMMLDSLRMVTREAEHYTQFMSVDGVTVKAPTSVAPAAVKAGAEIVTSMLSGRQDVARCMFRSRAELAITPRDEPVTSLPEFEDLVGTTDFTGRSRDSFQLRGLGAVRGQPVTAAAEEQLLGLIGPQHPYYPYRGLVAVHEFAHAIQNLCLAQDEHDRWDGFYEEAVRDRLFPGTHMMANVQEFFAVFSTAYFEVTDELGRGIGREDLARRFPEISKALEEIYGDATVLDEYRTRLEPRR